MAVRSSRRQHPVHIVHRVSAAVLGIGLWVFAVLGLVNGLAFFSTEGRPVLGLSSNGLLSTISLVAGAILIVAAVVGGPLSSTTTLVMGVLFVVSGLVHLAVLGSPYNVLAFELPNVFFSLVAGLVLLLAGAYGRFSAGLPADNPYRRARHPEAERTETPSAPSEYDEEVLQAEIAMGEGHPTPEQETLVEQDHARRRDEERRRAYRAAENGNKRARGPGS